MLTITSAFSELIFLLMEGLVSVLVAAVTDQDGGCSWLGEHGNFSKVRQQ